MNESIEHIPSGRELLQLLEAEDKYVFHGSANPNLELLEPRQGYNHRNSVREPDGDPAVFASNRSDYAILKALINLQNCPNGSRASARTTKGKDGEIVLTLRATQSSLDQLTEDASGVVYVFDKDQFEHLEIRNVEYISRVPVAPLRVIRVTKKDLPPCLEVME